MTYAELKAAYHKVCGTNCLLQERVASLEATQRQVPHIPHLCLCNSKAVCVLAISSEKARQTPCQKLQSPP